MKFGYQEEISWGIEIFKNVTTTNVKLYLGTDEYNDHADVDNKTWREGEYTWNEIKLYGTP